MACSEARIKVLTVRDNFTFHISSKAARRVSSVDGSLALHAASGPSPRFCTVTSHACWSAGERQVLHVPYYCMQLHAPCLYYRSADIFPACGTPGERHVLRTDVLVDVGKSMNPAIDIGQVRGGGWEGGVGWGWGTLGTGA